MVFENMFSYDPPETCAWENEDGTERCSEIENLVPIESYMAGAELCPSHVALWALENVPIYHYQNSSFNGVWCGTNMAVDSERKATSTSHPTCMECLAMLRAAGFFNCEDCGEVLLHDDPVARWSSIHDHWKLYCNRCAILGMIERGVIRSG